LKQVKRLPFSRRTGTAGIIAAAFLFAMLFGVGASYFVFINSANQLYVKSQTSRTSLVLGALGESLSITSLLNSGHIAFTATNLGATNANITAVYVLDSSNNVLKCDGRGLPSASCSNSTPALPLTVNVQGVTATVDTGYTYVSGTDTIKVFTARGGVYSTSYPTVLPNYAKQAQSSGSMIVDLSTYRWINITGNSNDQQTGALVGGYPAVSIPTTCDGCSYPKQVFKITFTNLDPQSRAITLWPQSEMGVLLIATNGDTKLASFFIVDGLNNANYPTGVTAYNTTQKFVTISANSQATLYFSATNPLGSTSNSLKQAPNSPFQALFTLVGQYSDKTLYGQTIPFPAGIATGSKVKLSAYSGGNGATITISCNALSGNCGLQANRIAFIGWSGSNNQVTVLKTFTTDCSGNIPAGTTFTVPTASTGYYTVVVSDHVNSLFYTFNHT
jgi:hypothetical protein